MQLTRFDLNLLVCLHALLLEKNVTRAAERVFVSQPAMSAALQKLRDYFNDPLLRAAVNSPSGFWRDAPDGPA